MRVIVSLNRPIVIEVNRGGDAYTAKAKALRGEVVDSTDGNLEFHAVMAFLTGTDSEMGVGHMTDEWHEATKTGTKEMDAIKHEDRFKGLTVRIPKANIDSVVELS